VYQWYQLLFAQSGFYSANSQNLQAHITGQYMFEQTVGVAAALLHLHDLIQIQLSLAFLLLC
jgi:hypothetical protein